MADESGRLECKHTKSRLFIVIFGGICLSIGSIFLIGSGQLKAIIAGWLGLLLFGVGTSLLVYRALKGGPVIIIDEVGFEDTRTGLGIIPWEEIRTLNVLYHKGVTIISLDTTDEEKLLSIFSRHKKLWFKIHGWYYGISPIYIYVTGLNHNLDEIIEFISECNYLTALDEDDESWPKAVVMINPLHAP